VKAMAIFGSGQDLKDLYKGYDAFSSVDVGAGLITPDIYASPSYTKKKTKSIMLGTLAEIAYGGADHDPTPLALPIKLVSQYNMIQALNLHYVPYRVRVNILKLVLKMNAARIKSNLSIMIDLQTILKMIPEAQYIIRNYKQVLIALPSDMGSVPLVGWEEAIKQPSRYENHWRLIKEGKLK
jgi:hypothetical protein